MGGQSAHPIESWKMKPKRNKMSNPKEQTIQKPLWEVQEDCICGDWTNTWEIDGEPMLFLTKEKAEKELADFLKEADEEFGKGVYEADQFRVVRIED
jgi:hypothetical protein